MLAGVSYWSGGELIKVVWGKAAGWVHEGKGGMRLMYWVVNAGVVIGYWLMCAGGTGRIREIAFLAEGWKVTMLLVSGMALVEGSTL